VTGLHGSPDDNLVRVKFCRQSQQLGSDVTVNGNEAEVDLVVGGSTEGFWLTISSLCLS
jgi:hypothetical protein